MVNTDVFRMLLFKTELLIAFKTERSFKTCTFKDCNLIIRERIHTKYYLIITYYFVPIAPVEQIVLQLYRQQC